MGENVEYPEVPLICLVEGRQIARCITGHLIRIDLSRHIRAGVGRRRRRDDPRQSDHSGHCQARNRKHLRKSGHVCLPQHRRPSGVSARDANLPDKDVRQCTRGGGNPSAAWLVRAMRPLRQDGDPQTPDVAYSALSRAISALPFAPSPPHQRTGHCASLGFSLWRCSLAASQATRTGDQKKTPACDRGFSTARALVHDPKPQMSNLNAWQFFVNCDSALYLF